MKLFQLNGQQCIYTYAICTICIGLGFIHYSHQCVHVLTLPCICILCVTV